MKKIIENLSEKYSLNISGSQIDKIINYYSILIDYQKKYGINLTKITEENDFVVKNVIDTLLINPYCAGAASAVDLGTGNGIPGIFIAIFNTELKVTLIDSTKKKIDFVDFCISELTLNNCSTKAERIEALPKTPAFREKFDIAIGRGLACLSEFTELAAPYLKNGGSMLCQKSHRLDEEIKDAEKILDYCSMRLESRKEYEIEGNLRIILKYVKLKKIPSSLPRRIGEYKKKLL